MSTKPTPLVNDISDAAGILRAQGHTELAERLLAFAEMTRPTATQPEAAQSPAEKERDAIAELNHQQWLALGQCAVLVSACHRLSAESEEYDFDDGLGRGAQQAYWDEFDSALERASEALDQANKETQRIHATQFVQPSQPEAAPAVAQMSLADAARHFPNGPFGQPRIAAPNAPAQASIRNLDGVIPAAISGYLRRCSSGGMPKKHIDIVQANVDEADRLGYFKLAIAQAMLAVAPEAPAQAAPLAGEVERKTIKARLDKAERDLREVGGWDNELHSVPAGGVRKLIEDVRATLASQQAVKEEATTMQQGALKLAIGAGTMQVGGRYKWKHQDERLVYLGVTWSGNRFWHQFALVDDLTKVWCEVPSSDLHMFELDTRP